METMEMAAAVMTMAAAVMTMAAAVMTMAAAVMTMAKKAAADVTNGKGGSRQHIGGNTGL
jgi:hypothetical protein